jgi:DnaJ-class molecular chaperone
MANQTTCPTCEGEGYTYEDRADFRGEHRTVEHDCDVCDGTGKVEAEAGDEEGAAA